MAEFDDEGYPPGSFGYEFRKLKAEILDLGGPDATRLLAKMDQLESWMADKRRAILWGDPMESAHPGEDSLPPSSEG